MSPGKTYIVELERISLSSHPLRRYLFRFRFVAPNLKGFPDSIAQGIVQDLWDQYREIDSDTPGASVDFVDAAEYDRTKDGHKALNRWFLDYAIPGAL